MSNTPAGKDAKAAAAQHGARSEVTWDGGEGRQPYTNQEPQAGSEPGGGDFSEGDRGELSGRNLEQLGQVKNKRRGEPQASENAEQHQQHDDDQRNTE
jgi:hypothetical protein